MSNPTSARDRRRSSAVDAPRSVRWRLWAAMLALALVPTAAGIYLTSSLLDPVEPTTVVDHAREASVAAAGLMARQQAVESRLLVAANDPAMGGLANGIDSAAERQEAARILDIIAGADGPVIAGACITRASDGRSIPLPNAQGSTASRACVDDSLRRRATAATTDTVTRASAGPGDAGRLLLATPLRSVKGRNSGVLSVELDVAALFDRARLPSSEAVTSMLVDMGASEVVASSSSATDPVDGAVPTIPLAAGIADHVEGILAERAQTDRDLAAMGLTSTVVPLWSDGNGSDMALLQLWPVGSVPMPFEVRLALLALLAGAIVAVIVLVRYFLHPFEEMADSRAELQVLYHEAREDALADGLTGLGNHRAFQEALGRLVKVHADRGLPFSLVLMDLDDLKVVNDREGHVAGDEMLRSMSRRMREMARANDLLFRTGGDEFAMILPNGDIEDAVTVAQRILHFCKRPTDSMRPFAYSAGISGVPYFTRDRDKVYRQADAALYWAKRHGRGSVEVFDTERDQLPDDASDADGLAVQEVVQGKLLSPVFQPIVDLRSGRILGFEGLIRPDPNGPLPDTARLFAAAAASGRTVELDLACLEAVVNGARAIGPDRLLTLNVSPRTLEMRDFDAAWLLQGLVRNGISPSRVIIELTERDEVDDLGRLRQTFAALQQYGLRLAADDVGAGNSGLRLLSQVQFDIVKIDLSLVHDGVRRMGSRAVLQSLRDLALSQNARIVAEGVETAEQLHVIRDLQIGAGQGFLLGRPEISVAKTFVDVEELANGLLVPQPALVAAVVATPSELAAEAERRQDGEDILSPERRAMFLPPARAGVLGAQPGNA